MKNIINNDEVVWNRLKSGDHGALEIIYNQEFGFLYNYGKKIARDQNTVEDAIQELFIELWERRESLSGTDHIRPYLTVSLKRKLIRKIRASQKTTLHEDTKEIIQDDGSRIVLDVDPDNPLSKELSKTLEQLSPRQKEVIYLKFYGGMDYDEIAQIMDLNYQSARNLVSRAIKTLSKHMVGLLLFNYLLYKTEYIASLTAL